MHKSIFREYDIRGKVGVEMPIGQVYDLARAIGTYILQHNPAARTVVVGRDGRTHSPDIVQELCRALVDTGFNVLDIGLCPTSVVYFSCHKLPVDAGIMVTASHNGPAYNGLKITLGTEAVWGVELQEIRKLYESQLFVQRPACGTYQAYSMTDRYIDWLVNQFSHLKNLDIACIFDCGNGATGAIMPQLVARMGWSRVKLLYAEIDGTFPHHEADPTIEANMQDLRAAMLQGGATLGIGFDGDGDRMASMTAGGYLVPGDKLLTIYAQAILATQRGSEAVNGVEAIIGMACARDASSVDAVRDTISIIYDIKCSSIVAARIQASGGVAHISPSGHSIIKSRLRKERAVFAGELSGHFFFADRYFGFDDGIYAALRLIELLIASGRRLEELVADLPVLYATHEFRIVCSEDEKQIVIERVHKQFELQPLSTILLLDGVRMSNQYGWALVRASNTQAVICVRCESATPEGLACLKQDVYRALALSLDADVLQELLQ